MKPTEDVKDGVRPENNRYHDRRTGLRRRWDASNDPRLLQCSPPRPMRRDAGAQVPSESAEVHRTTKCVKFNSHTSTRTNCSDVSTQVPSKPKLRSTHAKNIASQPAARIAGGNGCNCYVCPSVEKPDIFCLHGLHQRYMSRDFEDCQEDHLPAGYRRFVEHDDLYLPPCEPTNPASRCPDQSCSPTDCCPCDLRLYGSDPAFADIYLPPSRPCTPAFPTSRCGAYQDPCNPCPPPCSPCHVRSVSPCGPKIVCSCPSYIKQLAPCPPPASTDYSYPSYIKKSPSCFTSPCGSPSSSPICPPKPFCHTARQPSAVYIDEVPAPPTGNRYVDCQECLCHKDLSTRSLCPSSTKVSPCRDCVCHLGRRSPSQGVRQLKGVLTRCQPEFVTPCKSRIKPSLSQGQCLECRSPHSCKGPPNCNPHYIVETPFISNASRSRCPSPSTRPGSPAGGGRRGSPEPSSRCPSPSTRPRSPGRRSSPEPSSRCQTCDCHKPRCPPQPRRGSSSYKSPPPSRPRCTTLVSIEPFHDLCCSPCRPVSPCRPLLAAEMLSELDI